MQPTVNIVPSESLPVSKVYHPSVDLNQKDRLKYVAFCGAKETVYYEYPASALSTSQAIFTVQLPSRETVLDRRLYAQFEFSVKFNFPARVGGGMVVAGGDVGNVQWGLRQYPISACTSSLACDLNSSRFSYNPSTICHALSHFGQNELFMRTFKSSGAGMRDLQQVSTNVDDPRTAITYYGANCVEETRNNLNYLVSVESSNGAGNSLIYPDSRSNITVGDNGSTSCTFHYKTIEPVMVSPFIAGASEEPGLSGLNNMQIVYTFSSLNRVIQGLPVTNGQVNDITSMVVTIDKASLLARLYTLHLDYPRPAQMYWSMYDIQRYIQTSSNSVVVANNTSDNSFSITSQVINFASHPKYIFIFVKPSEYVEQAVNGITMNDTFCRIKNLNVTYCNKLCLQSAPEQELYAMSIRNGLTGQWSMWRAHTGSVLCLNVSTDLSLGEGESSGVGNGQYSFQCTVTASRPSSQVGSVAYAGAGAVTSYTMDLCICPVFEGFLTCGQDGIMKTIIGPLRKDQVLKAPTEHGAFEYYNSLYKLFGSGSALSGLKSIASKVSSVLSKPVSSAPVVSSSPHRESEERDDHGGRLLSRHDLAKRLQKL